MFLILMGEKICANITTIASIANYDQTSLDRGQKKARNDLLKWYRKAPVARLPLAIPRRGNQVRSSSHNSSDPSFLAAYLVVMWDVIVFCLSLCVVSKDTVTQNINGVNWWMGGGADRSEEEGCYKDIMTVAMMLGHQVSTEV